jgi:hypothetical protein
MTKIRLKFVPNLAQVLGGQADVKAIAHERAEEALTVAQDIAPVTTGHYRDSLQVKDNQLLTDDPMGHLVEWGSAHNRAYAVLRQAADEVATRVEEDPR